LTKALAENNQKPCPASVANPNQTLPRTTQQHEIALFFMVLAKKQKVLPVGIVIEHKVITICTILVIKQMFFTIRLEI
jgi:hypothetical protein